MAMSSQARKGFEYLDIWAISNSRSEILINVKNIGTLEAIIIKILIEGKPLNAVNGGGSNPRMPIYLKESGSETITLNFSSPLPAGITNILFYTYSGKSYPKTVMIM
jgi:hypothetical protein